MASSKRWHGTLKQDCLQPSVPLSIDEARTLVARFVEHYNHTRLYSVTPADKLAGREPAIFATRDQKLAAARERHAALRHSGLHSAQSRGTIQR